MKPDLIRALQAVGVTAEQIVEAQVLLADEHRMKETIRKANYRKNLKAVPNVPGTDGTKRKANYMKNLKAVPNVPGTDGTKRKANYMKNLKAVPGTDGTKRKVSPHPSKEKTFVSEHPTNKLSEGQDPLPLSLDDSFINNSARARSKTHANGGNGHDHFEDFWIAYPNKVGKAAARTAFQRALTRASIEVIADGLRRYCGKTDDRPWCHPTTWLNQDRWLDQPAEPVPKQDRLSARERGRDEVRQAFANMREERLRREQNAKG